MASPLGPWTCDSCGKVISGQQPGLIEWDPNSGTTPNLRLIHTSCSQRPRTQSETLAGLHGPDGLVKLLLITLTKVHPAEITRMISRLHIPGYEQARTRVSTAIAKGLIDPNKPKDFLWQSEIETILKTIP